MPARGNVHPLERSCLTSAIIGRHGAMESGMSEGFERLEELLATMTKEGQAR